MAREPQQLPGDACVANATTRVGVFKKGTDNAAAKAALNKQINPVHSKLSQTNPSLPVSEVGVENQIWHKEVVQRAVIDAGYHFFKVQIAETEFIWLRVYVSLFGDLPQLVGLRKGADAAGPLTYFEPDTD